MSVLGEAVRQAPKSQTLKRVETMANGKCGRPREASPKIYRYNFKLDAEQNIRFLKMLAEAGCERNKSHFIVSRIFG